MLRIFNTDVAAYSVVIARKMEFSVAIHVVNEAISSQWSSPKLWTSKIMRNVKH